MSLSAIANRYGKSLIELAQDQNILESVVQDMTSFQNVLENKDFKLMLSSPIVKGDKKANVFNALFGERYQKMTNMFFDIVIRKGRESMLPAISSAFLDQYKRLQHVSTVRLTTAQEMSTAELEAITSKLLNSSSTDEGVEIKTIVDPELIGGFVLEYDDQLYDDSVRTRLEGLKKEFNGNTYISKIIKK